MSSKGQYANAPVAWFADCLSAIAYHLLWHVYVSAFLGILPWFLMILKICVELALSPSFEPKEAMIMPMQMQQECSSPRSWGCGHVFSTQYDIPHWQEFSNLLIGQDEFARLSVKEAPRCCWNHRGHAHWFSGAWIFSPRWSWVNPLSHSGMQVIVSLLACEVPWASDAPYVCWLLFYSQSGLNGLSARSFSCYEIACWLLFLRLCAILASPAELLWRFLRKQTTSARILEMLLIQANAFTCLLACM